MLATVIVLLIVILDQLSKYLAVRDLYGQEVSEVIPGVLNFHYSENPGAAWGILSDHRWVFLVVSSVAIAGMIAYLFFTRKNKDLLLNVALSFFIGGGIGNMIDRIAQGYVVDFLEFGFMDFPIFNVADSFVTVGAVLIVIYLIRDLARERRNKKNPEAAPAVQPPAPGKTDSSSAQNEENRDA